MIDLHQTLSMTRSKTSKKKKATSLEVPIVDASKVPIPNLPDNFLWMKVKSCTKIRNVLEYSLKEFSNHKCVVWSGAGQGIAKVISCAEIFKRKQSGLHQITKLRYVRTKNHTEGKDEKDDRQVPEMHILLSTDALNIKEPGYQAPGICPMFQDSEITGTKTNEHRYAQDGNKRMSNVTAEEFAAMGLRTGQKRPRRDNPAITPTKKNKKHGGNEKKR